VEKLIKGIHRFQSDVFAQNLEFYRKLVEGQNPQALFITCSDSRVVPELICQTDPGDLFVLRNAGNIVAPYIPNSPSGEAATLEYAIKGLGVRDVIVCGHTRCGAMQAVANPESTAAMPRVRYWLEHAQAGMEIVCTCYSHLPAEAQAKVLIQENVLVQLEHLRTHPAAAAALAAGDLRLHAWVYKIETGQIFAYDAAVGQFTPLVRSPDGDHVAPPSIDRHTQTRTRAAPADVARAI
jgi:carbonic anhydrase